MYCRFNRRNSSSSPSRICCNSTGVSTRPLEDERPEALGTRRAEVELITRGIKKVKQMERDKGDLEARRACSDAENVDVK